MADDVFRRHPAARLMGADGKTKPFKGPARATGPDRPAIPALLGAMAAAEEGLSFRIGGRGPAPAPGAPPVFETLTGGTTGTPRRIRRTHASWIASFAADAARFGIGPGVSVAVPGRLIHSLPLYGAIGALHLGADLHLLEGMRPDRQRRELALRRIAVLWATPAHLALMLNEGGPFLPDLRVVLVGGGTLGKGLRALLASIALQARVVTFYGTAETSFVAMADDDTPPGSVGRPCPRVEVETPQDVPGPLRIRSPYLAEGYAGPAGSAVWEDGWVRTGDLGWMRSGHLFLAGRADRALRIADQTVWPDAVEAFLLTQPGVAGAAVVPRPDAARGHVLDAVLIGERDAEPAILSALRAAFGPLSTPRRIVWRDSLPLTPAGKVDLAALAAS